MSINKSDVYGIAGDRNDDAMDIADHALSGKVYHAPDSIGLDPEKLADYGQTHVLDIEKELRDREDTATDHARTHQADVEGGSKSSRERPAGHEHTPAHFGPGDVHTDAYKDHP